MGRSKKYNAKKLSAAVERYFGSISRMTPVLERYDTGKTDEKGHTIYGEREVKNRLGETVERLEYLIPPSIGGLCVFLGISRDTWSEYCADTKMAGICRDARERVQLWNEEELLTRKDVKGIIFNLENNFGYKEQQNVKVDAGIEEYLRALSENGGEQEF